MIYEGDIYRPPSEAYSLIVQVTVGCTHNKCAFCTSFADKRFHIRKFEDIEKDFLEMRYYYSRIERVFLADADAMCLSTEKLLKILNMIKRILPECRRVAAYARAAEGLSKSKEELISLREAGLGIVYIGAESGSDKVLKFMNKGEDRDTIIKGVRAFEEAGIKTSITFISGLGGKELTKEHAIETASMINEMKASYVSLLTLMLHGNERLADDIRNGKFEMLSAKEVLDETKILLENINLNEDSPCVFRSNHASNYLVLAGTLPYDKKEMQERLYEAIKGNIRLRPDFLRG